MQDERPLGHLVVSWRKFIKRVMPHDHRSELIALEKPTTLHWTSGRRFREFRFRLHPVLHHHLRPYRRTPKAFLRRGVGPSIRAFQTLSGSERRRSFSSVSSQTFSNNLASLIRPRTTPTDRDKPSTLFTTLISWGNFCESITQQKRGWLSSH